MDWQQRQDLIEDLVGKIHAGQIAGRAAAVSAMLDLASNGADLACDVFRELVELRQDEKLAASELEPHLSQILGFWNVLYAKLKPLQEDGPGTEWMLEGEYQESREVAEAVLDLLGYLRGDAASPALREGLTLNDPRLKTFAIASLLRRREPVDGAEIEQAAASNQARILFWRALCKLGATHLMPERWAAPQELAASELVEWAEVELGAPPEEIELMFQQPFEDKQGRVFDAYLFRFREYPKPWEPGEGWMAGIAGPFLNGQALASPWSSFDRWDSMSDEEHFEKLFRRATTCGRGD